MGAGVGKWRVNHGIQARDTITSKDHFEEALTSGCTVEAVALREVPKVIRLSSGLGTDPKRQLSDPRDELWVVAVCG